ncbi:hypothetical protein [Mesorhizobium sp.]|uniref:hypothetical protein n=1 Tax=Mesorhizobium sp. TaxID=1871066 RepID=UPI000FE49037|nr:hypothetical protein [Mesorhizobium sp.]RWI70868.1 MAG: hypothetical protein EOR19_26620 [Mesorhizobium sp.]
MGEPVKAAVAALEAIGPALLSRLPSPGPKTVLRLRWPAGNSLADWVAINDFRTAVTAGLDGLLYDDPMAFVRQLCALPTSRTVEADRTIGIVGRHDQGRAI